MPDKLPRATFRANVVNLFKAYPNVWIDARNIQRVGGNMAWRTRLSEARRFNAMDIKNRYRRVGDYVVSEYMWVVPISQPVQPGLFEDTHVTA